MAEHSSHTPESLAAAGSMVPNLAAAVDRVRELLTSRERPSGLLGNGVDPLP